MAFSYRLTKKEESRRVCYTKQMLDNMPTYMLHDICVKERIMTGFAGVPSAHLEREELVELILRYRGEKKADFHSVLYPERNELIRLLKGIGREVKTREIEVPVRIRLYKDTPLTLLDAMEVVVPSESQYSHAFLLDGYGEVQTLFALVRWGEKTCLTMKKEWMREEWEPGDVTSMELLFVGGDTAFCLAAVHNGEKQDEFLFGKELCYVRCRLEKLTLSECPEAEMPLILDFGTSNTTAGYCDAFGEVSLIRFKDHISCQTCTGCGLCFLYPSVAAVESCGGDAKGSEIEMRFGEEAWKEQKKDGCLSFGTCFYDMKRFVSDYETLLEVTDRSGNIGKISKLLVVRQYLLSVIRIAQEREKCKFRRLCFTTPVKQKEQMISMLKAALWEFSVEDFKDVDEGMAVLYYELELLRREGKLTDREGNVLILDVGGGTSDLVCCQYSVSDEGISYRLSMEESYANGDTNFGGNNLTYRILMYIKLKLYYIEMKQDVFSILPPDFFDPYNAVDDDGGSKVLYDKLEVLYREAEIWLPTRFSEEVSRSSNRYKKVKSNYYTLWNVAEAMKKQFFQDTLISQISLPEGLGWEEYSIYLQQGTELVEVPLQLTLTKEEVLTVITPDIYSLVKRFLEPLCDEDGILSGYSIKLSGQTCQIPIFREAVKEFTVGQRSRSRHKRQNWCGLKLKCIDGAVNAWKNREYGYVLPEICKNSSMTPYEVTAKTHAGREVVLIPHRTRLNEAYGFLSRPSGTKEVSFWFCSGDRDTGYEVRLKFPFDAMKPVSYECILEDYRDTPLRQSDLDTIREGELKLFLLGDESRWGIWVVPTGRSKEKLYLGERQFMPFDLSRWNVDFFDGNK